MTVSTVKAKIKKKFGTYSNFARAARFNEYNFRKDFLTNKKVLPHNLDDINRLCDTLEVPASKDEVPAEVIEKIKARILAKGGVIHFCENALNADGSKKFSQAVVFNLLNGSVKGSKSAHRIRKHFRL